MKVLILTAALFIAGCSQLQGVGERDPVKEIIAGCNAIAGGLNVLTPNIDRLSPGQIETVNRVDRVSRPICTADEPPATSVDLIKDLASQLVAVQVSVSQGGS